MCGSMVDIQSVIAENRRGKKIRMIETTAAKRKWCHNNKHFAEVALHDGGKAAGMDMLWRNYVTGTLCITIAYATHSGKPASYCPVRRDVSLDHGALYRNISI